MICTYISINMESLPFRYACAERVNRDNTHIFQNYLLQIDFSYKSMRNGNCYTKFGSEFCCYAIFLVCNIRDNTFSDRNTSFYHMTWELIVTKISIFIGVSIRHSIMIKVKLFYNHEVEGK